MYGVYAAEVQYHHDRAEQERRQRLLVLRAQRGIPEPPLRPRMLRSGVVAWPRPIVLHLPA